MKQLNLGKLQTLDDVIRALRQIETASKEIDAMRVADNFTVSNFDEATTAQRTIDLDLTAQTTDDMVARLMYVVGTWLNDLKKRGAKRA